MGDVHNGWCHHGSSPAHGNGKSKIIHNLCWFLFFKKRNEWTLGNSESWWASCGPNNSPVVRSKSQGSEGAAPGLSVATADTSVQEGLQALAPTLPRHFPSPQPTHTCGRGPAPAPQLRLRSPRRLLHPCALWWVKSPSLVNTQHSL